ncbi:indolepyruvate ferredoxin oxidoreductase subunit alpha [Patescibacteria group bacterium]|nr:indolepyruvate ferredoxin oxidoreductase subunit alpha [Patescibacteria group bacterium]MBU1876929.1 indolepyruvate ferredoxin oxidoreductase subunit alpha [Patescibacteria group bacterium]
MEEILKNQKGKLILLGNEAIVRGALESGVQFVTTYPGTPASEIGNVFFRIAKEAGVYFEFSTNEKVALEAAAGASFSGLRTLMAMKNFGVNVASDFLLPLCYSGTKGEMVIMIADDPSCWSSAQTEENTRSFAYLAHLPFLEPSTPQECKDFTKLAFKLSGQFKLPIVIRETTRLALQSAPVKLDKIIPGKTKGKFIKNPHQFSTMPPRVLGMKNELLAKIEKIREISEKSPLNQIDRGRASINSEVGIITSGVSYLYVKEALQELNIELPILKLGFFYPLPEKKISSFIKKFKKVLIVEELEPFLEREVERLAKTANPKLQIFGKNLIPITGELKPEYVILAVSKIISKKLKFNFSSHLNKFKKLKIARRFPQLCSGCPYWLVFSAIKRAAPKDTIFGGEIGCYMLAAYTPHEMQDYLFCMGSSTSIAHGISQASGQKVIAFMGDSSFFHAGIPALINTVFNKSNPLVVILDNSTTAMTGQQPNPGAPVSGNKISIENIVKAIGIKNIKIISLIDTKELEETVKEFLNNQEASVIIVRKPCIRI